MDAPAPLGFLRPGKGWMSPTDLHGGTFLVRHVLVRADVARPPRGTGQRLRETDHAEAADLALSVLRWEGPLHAERGAVGRQELPPLRHARRAPRMAREAVRPDADPPDGAGRTGLAEDRDAGDEGSAQEGGEEGLVEHGSAFEAVAPIFSDRGPALSALAAGRGLIGLDDDEVGPGDLVPSRLSDQEEREIVIPRLQLEECEFLRGEQFVHGLHEIPDVFEPDDFLLVPQDQLLLPQVEFLVEPGEVLQLHAQLEGTEPRVDLLEERVRLEDLGDPESEPVPQDAGHGPVRLRPIICDEGHLASRVRGHALREDALRQRDGEAQIDEGGMGLPDRPFRIARLGRPGRRGGLGLLLFRLLRLWSEELRLRFLARGLLGLRTLFDFGLALFFRPLLGLVLLPTPDAHRAHTWVADNNSCAPLIGSWN